MTDRSITCCSPACRNRAGRRWRWWRRASDAIDAFARSDVDGVAGNHLTMRFLMGTLAENAVEVPLISRPYHLAVLPGRENVVAPLRVALDRLKSTGEFDRLVELHLSNPVRRTWLDRYATILAIGGGVALLLFVGGTAWNRSLHRQVQARTKAVERTERRYRDLVDNASDMIYRTDPFGRFTFVNPVATRILGFDEGELLSMKYFELMRPDWVPRAMGFYEKSAKTRESTYLEFPVRKKDGDRDLGRPARAADHHRRPRRRLPGHGARHHRSRQRPVGAARRARFRLGDPRHRAEPDHGARFAGPHRALQPRLRRAVRRRRWRTSRAAPIWELPFVLDEERDDDSRRTFRGWPPPTVPVKLDRTWVGKTGARHVIAWTVMALRGQTGRHLVPDRHRAPT